MKEYRFYTERYNVVKYKNSPFYKGVELWDSLPLPIIDCGNIFDFKAALKKVMGPYIYC